MMRSIHALPVLCAVLFALAAAPLQAQSRELAVADTSPFRRLELPAANEARTGSGRPGARYWQQRADYAIRATLDSARATSCAGARPFTTSIVDDWPQCEPHCNRRRRDESSRRATDL
jgi:hypothetical protein